MQRSIQSTLSHWQPVLRCAVVLLPLLTLSCSSVNERKWSQLEAREIPSVWTSDYRLELRLESAYPLRIAGLVTQRRSAEIFVHSAQADSTEAELIANLMAYAALRDQSSVDLWSSPSGGGSVVLSPLWNGVADSDGLARTVHFDSTGQFTFNGDDWIRARDPEGFLLVRGRAEDSSRDFDGELRIELGAVAQALEEEARRQADEVAASEQLRREELQRTQFEEQEKAAHRNSVDARIAQLRLTAGTPVKGVDALLSSIREDLELARLLAEPHRGSVEDRVLAIEALDRAIANSTTAGSAELLSRAIEARAKFQSN